MSFEDFTLCFTKLLSPIFSFTIYCIIQSALDTPQSFVDLLSWIKFFFFQYFNSHVLQTKKYCKSFVCYFHGDDVLQNIPRTLLLLKLVIQNFNIVNMIICFAFVVNQCASNAFTIMMVKEFGYTWVTKIKIFYLLLYIWNEIWKRVDNCFTSSFDTFDNFIEVSLKFIVSLPHCFNFIFKKGCTWSNRCREWNMLNIKYRQMFLQRAGLMDLRRNKYIKVSIKIVRCVLWLPNS